MAASVKVIVYRMMLLFTAVACAAVLGAQADTDLQQVLQANDAYVRVPVPGQKNSAAYFSLHNTGSEDVILVAVEAPLADRAELHSHQHDDTGIMRMRREDQWIIPAGGTLTLQPGGLHVMLFDLNRTIRTADRASLELIDIQGRRFAVEADVRSLFDDNHDHHDHNHHH